MDETETNDPEASATEALADAWGSIEGAEDGAMGGLYDEDAAEMIRRLETRGFCVVRHGAVAALEARCALLEQQIIDAEQPRSREYVKRCSGGTLAAKFAEASAGWEKEKRAHEITSRQRDQGLRELEGERKLRREALAGWEADKKLHTKTMGELAHLRGLVLALSSSIRLAADDLGRVAT